MEYNENRLVPGGARPPTLGALGMPAGGMPAAHVRPSAASLHAATPARPRRFRRAGSAWAGALVLGSVLMAVTSLVLLDRGGGPLRTLLRGTPAPAMADEGLSLADKEKYWTLAGYESTRFALLMGVQPHEPARMEEDARRLERLLSGPAQRP